VSTLAAEIAQSLAKKAVNQKLQFKNLNDPIISEAHIDFNFDHAFRRAGLSQEDLKAKLEAVNKVSFSAEFVKNLKSKLPGEHVEGMIAEYKRYLFMMACSS
jgi:methyltransferase-like protein